MEIGLLYRYKYGANYTRGVLLVGDKMLHTLEPAWRNNERNQSCIPTGTYNCTYLPKSASGKYKKVYHITGVPDRTGILIHNGNLPSHTKGCVLVGTRAGILANSPAVLGSRTAMGILRAELNNKDFIIQVV